MFKLTVLMPVYNREKFVKEAIESILNQTYKDFTLLIYDDGSTDNTVKIIKELQNNDSRITLIQGEVNKGGLYAKQILLDMCETEIACWQDSDDISMPTRLEKQLSLIEYGVVYTDWCFINFYNNKWIQGIQQRHTIGLTSMMFKVDKKIKMDITRIWGSKVWFNTMQTKYSNYKRIKENLYHIRKHPGRITEIKSITDKLIRMGKIKEEDFIHLNYEQLIEFLKLHK
jgi:glycosyltransferase involved in cell wall biosynthesis